MTTKQDTVIPFPSTRELCHWCGENRKEVETLVLSQQGAKTFKRSKLKICHFCIDSWQWFAKQAEHPFHKTRLPR